MSDTLCFRRSDGWFVAYGILFLFHMLILEKGQFDCFVWYKLLAMLICYLLVRTFASKRTIISLILLIGLWQAIVALLQKTGYMASNHRLFDITGTLGNPGQLGGLIAISMVIAIGVSIYFKNSLLRIGILFYIIIVGYVFLLADSRASWLACMAGILYISIGKRKKFFTNKYILSILFIGIISLSILGYYYKKDSADGRLLIWRITLEMIAEHPIIGYGVEGFSKNYMYYQAIYFREHPNPDFQLLADNIIYPYNELLRIWVEFGLLGVICILGLLWSVLHIHSSNKENRILKGGCITFILFSCFSYPSSVIILNFIAVALIGSLDSKASISGVPGYYKYIIICISLIGIWDVWNGYRKQDQLDENLKKTFAIDAADSNTKKYLKDNYEWFKYNAKAIDLYAIYCKREYAEYSLPILLDAIKVAPTCELYVDLGDIYWMKNEYRQAEKAYMMASNMIPSRILPKYQLFLLYKEIGDRMKMRSVGHEILHQPVKVTGTHVLKMKATVRNVLSTDENSSPFQK